MIKPRHHQLGNIKKKTLNIDITAVVEKESFSGWTCNIIFYLLFQMLKEEKENLFIGYFFKSSFVKFIFGFTIFLFEKVKKWDDVTVGVLWLKSKEKSLNFFGLTIFADTLTFYNYSLRLFLYHFKKDFHVHIVTNKIN